MANSVRRNRLTPWYVGVVIILAAVAYVAYYMHATSCSVTTPVYAVLLVIPIVYLVLMYLTLTSQE